MTKDFPPKDNMMMDFDVLFQVAGDQSQLLVSCRRTDYSASLLSRAVEDCDAQVLNLNVTSLDGGVSRLLVALRVNHRNPAAVAHSLERYGFEVVDATSGSEDENERMRQRANEVLRYLEL